MEKNFVYMFDHPEAKGKEMLGGKGANLTEMTRIGLPVPYGFTITTAACNDYYDAGKKISPEVENEVTASLKTLEENTGKRLGDPQTPFSSPSVPVPCTPCPV